MCLGCANTVCLDEVKLYADDLHTHFSDKSIHIMCIMSDLKIFCFHCNGLVDTSNFAEKERKSYEEVCQLYQKAEENKNKMYPGIADGGEMISEKAAPRKTDPSIFVVIKIFIGDNGVPV